MSSRLPSRWPRCWPRRTNESSWPERRRTEAMASSGCPAATRGPPASSRRTRPRRWWLLLPALSSSGDVELRIALDPDQPVEDSVPPPVAPDDTWLEPTEETVEATGAATNLVVLAGPGVIRDGAVPGLHDLAISAGVGVLNTWGAKGVFDWRSRHHLATVGLQADDFVLSELDRADLIIATGLDPAESPDDRWRLAPALTVPPAGLAPLAERCRARERRPLTMPPLRARLAEVTQRGWGLAASPLPPSRVTMHYAECVAAGALVAADAGDAGFWVARTLGTTRLGAVIVPSTPSPGFAAACAAVSLLRHPGRPALAVIDLVDAEATAAVVEAAAALGVARPGRGVGSRRGPPRRRGPPGAAASVGLRRAPGRGPALHPGHRPASAVGDDRGGRADRGLDLTQTVLQGVSPPEPEITRPAGHAARTSSPCRSGSAEASRRRVPTAGP